MSAQSLTSTVFVCVSESTGPAKVVRAGNPPKTRRGGKVRFRRQRDPERFFCGGVFVLSAEHNERSHHL